MGKKHTEHVHIEEFSAILIFVIRDEGEEKFSYPFIPESQLLSSCHDPVNISSSKAIQFTPHIEKDNSFSKLQTRRKTRVLSC